MDIQDLLSGGLDPTALFGVNTVPTQDQIEAAQRDVQVYGEAAEKLVAKVGLRPGLYVAEQPIFGPLVRLLSLAGWTIGGSGYFSAVFYNGGLAIKISLRGSNDAAMDYLDWCKDHQGMPGIPQVFAMKQMEHTYAVLMDRLEPVVHLLNNRSADYDEFVDAEYQEIKEALNTGAAPQYFHTAATALAIRHEFIERANIDMHKGNIMQDRDGKIIITDPLGRSDDRPTCYGGDYYTYTSSNDNYSQAA